MNLVEFFPCPPFYRILPPLLTCLLIYWFMSLLQTSYLVLPMWLLFHGLQSQLLEISQLLFNARAMGLDNFRMRPLHPESAFWLHFWKSTDTELPHVHFLLCGCCCNLFFLMSMQILTNFVVLMYFVCVFLIRIFGFISVELYYWL